MLVSSLNPGAPYHGMVLLEHRAAPYHTMAWRLDSPPSGLREAPCPGAPYHGLVLLAHREALSGCVLHLGTAIVPALSVSAIY